jgi:receptor protein-tyrosine kinase
MDQAPTRGTDLEGLLRTLRRRRALIALCSVLAVASALGFSIIQHKQYSASASLLFRDPGFDQKLFGSNFLPPSTDPTREAATNAQLVSLETVAARASRVLKGRLSPDTLSRKVSVESNGQSNLVSVTATDRSPRFAAKLADTVALQYIAFRREADRAKIQQAQNLVQSQLRALQPAQRNDAGGRSLQGRADQLSILASLQTGNAELVQPAEVPKSPSSPTTARNTILGGVLGLLLGIGLALLMERLNRRVRTPEELGEAYGLSVLSIVPIDPVIATTRPWEKHELWNSPAIEAFRTLRGRLRYFNVDRQIGSVLVTSPAPEDGKSTVAWYLAMTVAMTRGARVLLVESDLRRPDLAHQHELERAPGLAELLTRDIDLAQVVQRVLVASQMGDGVPAHLDVLVAGLVPPNPAELIESQRMDDLLESATADYDFVVLDTPPTSIVSDTMPLMSKVDGVIVVSRVGKTTRHAAAHFRDQLRKLKAPVLGVVANMVKPQGGDYYGYAYAIREEALEAVSEKETAVSSTDDKVAPDQT